MFIVTERLLSCNLPQADTSSYLTFRAGDIIRVPQAEGLELGGMVFTG